MTNFQYPMVVRARRPVIGFTGEPPPPLAIGDWDLVIPAIIRDGVRE
jgi:hypothetical protein